MSELFRYTGPARIGGLEVPEVSLREEQDRSETGRLLLRSWQGSAIWRASQKDGSDEPIPAIGQVLIELTGASDVPTGQAFVSAVTYDGEFWSLEIVGVGPPPGWEG